MLKCYKYIYNSDTKSVFFLLIANWSLPHSPVYLPIYLNIQVEKKEYLHKEIEDKDGQPKVFLIPYTPEIAAKCIFDTIDNDLYSKSGSEGSPNLISTILPLPHEVLYFNSNIWQVCLTLGWSSVMFVLCLLLEKKVMTYSDPMVTYSHRKMTYSYPKVT